ncbi:MAG: S4 domain-containing protein [Bacteroidota bacterium]
MSKQDKKGKAYGKKGGYSKTNRGYGKDNEAARPKKKNAPRPASDGIRLNKYIANSGICSRREADLYIQTGQVTVNGKVINEMGYRVKPNEDVRFDGRRISPEPTSFVLLNKPKGVATTSSESKGLTVMDIIANATNVQVKPFGRLGRNATGLLLFTNDDAFRQKFSKKGIDRLFHIELDKNLKAADLQKIREGLKIDGKEVKVEDVSYVNNAPKKEVGLKIKHTGNSVIRNIFDQLNYNVVKVDCVTLGPLTKKDLPRGRYRHLTEQEVSMFNML